MTDVFLRLAIALGLGLLIGLQRQRTESEIAGIRTFSLIGLFGAVSGLLAAPLGAWVVGGGLLALAVLAAVGNFVKLRAGDADSGVTTETAMLLVYALGVYLSFGEPEVAIVAGGVVAVLLHLKRPMHRWVERLGDRDARAIMQFVVITLVILPILPDRTYGPFDVLNPQEIWLMVVLIVALGLAGYVAFKLFGEGAGTALAGVLGGLVSSTATTVTYARRSHEEPKLSPLASAVIVIASAVVFVRVLVEVAVVAPGVFQSVWPPLAAMLAAMAALAAVEWLLSRRDDTPAPEPSNPSELKSALVFGGLYALVLLAVAAAKEHLGRGGLYAVAALSGLTDVDAITLSTAQLMEAGRLEIDSGWRVILLASLSNLVFKLGVVGFVGNRRLLLRVGVFFAAALVAGAAIFFFWPRG